MQYDPTCISLHRYWLLRLLLGCGLCRRDMVIRSSRSRSATSTWFQRATSSAFSTASATQCASSINTCAFILCQVRDVARLYFLTYVLLIISCTTRLLQYGFPLYRLPTHDCNSTETAVYIRKFSPMTQFNSDLSPVCRILRGFSKLQRWLTKYRADVGCHAISMLY